MNFPADAFAATSCKHRLLACRLGCGNGVHRPCHAPWALGLLILASDRLKAEPRAFARYVVPASAGGAQTLSDALDCLTLKTDVQPKETKETKEFESFTKTRPPTYRVNGSYLRTSFLSAIQLPD